ncbi:MAG: hypothetical protein ACT4OO_02670 [Nitrospiraceae bacterium]
MLLVGIVATSCSGCWDARQYLEQSCSSVPDDSAFASGQRSRRCEQSAPADEKLQPDKEDRK